MYEFTFSYLLTALIAGILTVTSPCVLPTLPIVLSGSSASRSFLKPLRIILGLAVSVTIFTLLLYATSSLLGVPKWFWNYLSGSILILFGLLILLKPNLWSDLIDKTKLKKSSYNLIGKSLKKGGWLGDFLIGASLGPVFTTCSPAYFVIAGAILPQDLSIGIFYLLAFIVGLVLILLLVAFLGQKFILKLSFITNPKSWFKVFLGILFILIGVLIMTGADKKIQAALVDRGLYDWLIEIEEELPSAPKIVE